MGHKQHISSIGTSALASIAAFISWALVRVKLFSALQKEMNANTSQGHH